MRRMVMLLLGMALLVLAAAGVALAVTKTCQNVPCTGTPERDVLYERLGNRTHDRIFGYRGNDSIDANTFNRDDDRVLGDGGRDRLLVDDGDGRDVVRGGQGFDICHVDRGDVARGCESVRGEGRSASGGDEMGFDLPASAF